jgi:hypothetical protein
MKKLLLVATLLTMMSQSFGAVSFILASTGGGNADISFTTLSTTTTTSVYASPVAGLVVYLDGEAAVNLNSSEAKELIGSAEANIDAGIELSEDEESIMAFQASFEE